VFVRRARVLPTPVYATRNLLVLEVSPAPSPCCFNWLFHLNWYGLVRKFHKMEIVQTGTNMWRWCVSMFGARFAVFVRRARGMPSSFAATRNFRSFRHSLSATQFKRKIGTGKGKLVVSATKRAPMQQ
jgi:hypothetical protein